MEVDLSLDEIIQKRKGQESNNKKTLNGKAKFGGNPNKKTKERSIYTRENTKWKAKDQLFDARDKIIQKTRARMLNSGFDARQKLEELRRNRQLVIAKPPGNPYKYERLGLLARNENFRSEVPTIKRRASLPQRIYKDIDVPERDEETLWHAIAVNQTQRTVKNVRPTMNTQMECIDLDAYDPHSRMVRQSQREVDSMWNRGHQGNSVLSERLRARLNSQGDTRASHGIYANETYEAQPLPPKQGYRIVVSNLHPEVTTKDIYELFSAIASPSDARIVRPGIAEVIYARHEDAEDAVGTYHNRHFDGKPMNCLLVAPRSSSNPIAPALNMARTNRKVDVDMDAVYSVLFKR